MPDYLLVSGEDPVNLTGTLDGSGALQIMHSTDNLANYSQTLHAEHSDLNQSTGLVMIKIFDFSSGGSTWQVTAAHGGTNWSRGTNYAYYEFGPQANPVEIDTTATNNSSPPTVKNRKIWAKPKPTDGAPDVPR